MHLRALGRLEVEPADGQTVGITGEKKQQLFALLLFSPNVALSTDHLIDALWGETPPPTARNSLHHHVASVRQVIGERLETTPNGYLLRIRPDELDAIRFTNLATEGAAMLRTDPSAAARRLREALDLWRGSVFEGTALRGSAREEASRLEELRLAAVENLWDALLAAGEDEGAVSELQRLADRHPFRERLWGLLMIAMYRRDRQTEALRVYQRVRKLLGEELGVEPSAWLRDVEERILLQDQSLLRFDDQPPPVSGVPRPFTTFVSREDELETVKKVLGDSRLVTLTGPPGVGKTRLAVETVLDLSGRFRDGIWWIDLAPLTEPARVVDHVAAELGPVVTGGPDAADDIRRSVASSQLLVVLDNCEQVAEGVASVAQTLLAAGPEIVVLATSRVVLGVSGETVWPVRPLDAPEDDLADLSNTLEWEAMRLFVDRAQAGNREFVLDRQTMPHVAAICTAVEGLPLALELVASQVAFRSVDELAASIAEDASGAGAQPSGPLARHSGLREAIGLSLQLLPADAERLLPRLSVFETGFTIDGAEAVVGEDRSSVIGAIGDLVKASLVVPVQDSSDPEHARYRLMQPVRDFVRGELRGPQLDACRHRHDTHYARIARQIESAIRTEGYSDWLGRLRIERADLLASLERSDEQGRREDSLDLAAALSHLWARGGRGTEGKPWLQRLLVEASGAQPGPLAEIATSLAVIESYQGAFDAALEHFELAVGLWRRSDERGLVDALSEYARLAIYMNDHSLARTLLDEALQRSDEIGYRWGRARPLAFHAQSLLFEGSFGHDVKSMFLEAADVLRTRGDDAGLGHVNSFLTVFAVVDQDFEGARRAAHACAEHYHRARERTEYPYAAFVLGLVSHAEGDHERALVLGRESLIRAERQGNRVHVGLALELLAAAHAAVGHAEVGARLLGAARRHQPMVMPFQGPLFMDDAVARLHYDLGGSRFETFTSEGGAMSVRDAVDFALQH